MPYMTDKYEGMIAETLTMQGHQGDTIHAYIARPLGRVRSPASRWSPTASAGPSGTRS